jgi:hypothetical protein
MKNEEKPKPTKEAVERLIRELSVWHQPKGRFLVKPTTRKK